MTMIEPPGVPDDIDYLASRFDTASDLLRKMLQIMAGTAKQVVQVAFEYPLAATINSTVYRTSLRIHVTHIVIPADTVQRLNFRAGNGIFLTGIGSGVGISVLPVSFDLEPGVDYQFTSTVAPFNNATTVWLLGYLEEG